MTRSLLPFAAGRLLSLLFVASLLGACATGAGPGGERADAGMSSGGVIPGSVIPGSSEESDARKRARIRLELAAGYYQQRNYTIALDELG